MSANDTTQLAVNGVVGGEAHVHTLHFRHMQPTLTEAQLIDLWQAGCRASYRAMFSSQDSPVVRIVARQVCGAVPLRAPAEESEVAPNVAGSIVTSGDRVPTWLASVNTVRTALGGRSRRGRYFIGGLWEMQVTGNDLFVNHRTDVQGYANSLLATFGPGGTQVGLFQLVVHSRKLAVPGVDCQNSSTFVSSITTQAALGSMRSRKPGHGT